MHKRMRACISVCARVVVGCVFGPAEAAGMGEVGGVFVGVFAAGKGEVVVVVVSWSCRVVSWACSQRA